MAALNPFTIAQQQLDTAAARLGLDRATHEFLRWPQKELVVTIPVQLDDGSTKIFRGYRVQYNEARGRTRGGSGGIPTRPSTPSGRWPPG